MYGPAIFENGPVARHCKLYTVDMAGRLVCVWLVCPDGSRSPSFAGKAFGRRIKKGNLMKKTHNDVVLTHSQKFLMLLGKIETKHQFTELDGLHRMILFQILDTCFSGNNITINQILDKKLSSRSSVYRKISDLKKYEFITEKWDGYICHLVPTKKIDHILSDIENWLNSNGIKG